MFLDFLDFLKHGDIFWISPARFFCGSENMLLAHDIGTQMGHKVPGSTEADWDGYGAMASTAWDVSIRDAMCRQYVPLKKSSLRLNLQMLFCPLSDSYILVPLSTLMSFCPAPIVG